MPSDEATPQRGLLWDHEMQKRVAADPDLARLIEIWDDVPEHLRQTILALVDALAVPATQPKRAKAKRSR